jgi:HTH-type transcriptional regulator / antitoxin HigA
MSWCWSRSSVRATVYEVLNRKRPPTLAMIRRLHESLGIPAKVLIAETVAG